MKLFAKGKGGPGAPTATQPQVQAIDRVGLLGLLDQVVNGGGSGTLQLTEPRGSWTYAFQNGALTHASGGRVRGARQAFDLLWEFQSGQFVFVPGPNPELHSNLYIDKGRLLDLLRRSQTVLQGPASPYIAPAQAAADAAAACGCSLPHAAAAGPAHLHESPGCASRADAAGSSGHADRAGYSSELLGAAHAHPQAKGSSPHISAACSCRTGSAGAACRRTEDLGPRGRPEIASGEPCLPGADRGRAACRSRLGRAQAGRYGGAAAVERKGTGQRQTEEARTAGRSHPGEADQVPPLGLRAEVLAGRPLDAQGRLRGVDHGIARPVCGRVLPVVQNESPGIRRGR